MTSYNEQVSSIVHSLLVSLAHLGVFGLLILGALDDSFLFLPLGNDLLLITLTVRNHAHLPLYVAGAACGSTLGCYVLDLFVRKHAGEGLKRVLSPARFKYVEKKVRGRAAGAVLIASLAPPPFAFTAVIAAASALHYPRVKMLALIALGRAVRFAIVGLLAISFGKHLIRIAQSTTFEWVMTGFIVMCAAGSVYSIYQWVRESKSRA